MNCIASHEYSHERLSSYIYYATKGETEYENDALSIISEISRMEGLGIVDAGMIMAFGQVFASTTRSSIALIGLGQDLYRYMELADLGSEEECGKIDYTLRSAENIGKLQSERERPG
jgi:hypothetical protein